MNIRRLPSRLGIYARCKLNAFWRNEEGLGTLEIVLIAAVIIAIAVLFKDWILEFLDRLFGKVEDKSDSFFS
ncbi:Flp1 family type IVb pilin [Cohnella hashimotonis]|uniref:Flp1 family type IVb pilin n=1 Tax=Cohnella hashimotonis TaxID=2826895 RepID=A0ABT6TKJ9_9BACL|nr:Flp1 family type IVb pilin [Cohnella hashimotonis]MDI4647249.1 Flp1 family type IVb pilin [Cohnella hashimotonis]